MDRHEYEINQLINPKKDIVKSNSKHRDNIETLILGRRIGGINRGGETPFTPTPWRFRMDSQQGAPVAYICGTTRKDTHGEVMLDIQGPTDRYAFAYGENGNVEYSFMPFDTLIQNKIIPHFNDVEKYGFMIVSEEAINIDDYLLINA